MWNNVSNKESEKTEKRKIPNRMCSAQMAKIKQKMSWKKKDFPSQSIKICL